MPTELTIKLFPSSRTTVVVLSGELDMSSAPGLTSALRQASQWGNELVLDLEELTFMDCAGLRVLTGWPGDGNGRGPALVAVTPGPPQVQRLFSLTGADRLFHVISPDSLELRPAAWL